MSIQLIYDDAWDDTIVPFTLQNSDVRGRLARINKSLCETLEKHNYPSEVSNLIAEALLLTVMIGQAIKLRWKLSLQIRGKGPIKLIATDYFSSSNKKNSSRIRAYANFDSDLLETVSGTDFQKLGQGFFALLIDQGKGTDPYQGITELSGNSLADCAEKYFDQSEQLKTSFKIIVGPSKIVGHGSSWRAGGIMLQHMPLRNKVALDDNNSKETLSPKMNLISSLSSDNSAENWSRVNILMDTVEELELVGPHVGSDELLRRLFHQEALFVFDKKRCIFGCSCSSDKVSSALSIYSSKDIASMTTPEGTVTADCQFCGEHYIFSPSSFGVNSNS